MQPLLSNKPEAIAAYKEMQEIIAKHGIRDVLELIALIASDFGEGSSSLPDDGVSGCRLMLSGWRSPLPSAPVAIPSTY